MRLSFVSAAVLALAPSAFAQYFDSITSPTRDQILPAGVPFDIIWAPEGITGTIKITLLEGKTNITLVPGPIIASGVNNLDGKYTWTPTDAGFETYGFFIEDEKNTTLSQYSQPFHIKGSGSSSSSSATIGLTTTIKLSTGPSYIASSTSTSTSSIPSSTVTVVSTSTSANKTSSFATPTPSGKPSPSSNVTLPSTSTTARTTAAGTTVVASTPASTVSTAPSSSKTATNAAMANFANGGLSVLAGLVLAFAL